MEKNTSFLMRGIVEWKKRATRSYCEGLVYSSCIYLCQVSFLNGKFIYMSTDTPEYLFFPLSFLHPADDSDLQRILLRFLEIHFAFCFFLILTNIVPLRLQASCPTTRGLLHWINNAFKEHTHTHYCCKLNNMTVIWSADVYINMSKANLW